VVKSLLKNAIRLLWLAIAFLPALLSGFGRFKPLYTFFSHACALGPGLAGDYLRTAFYHLTLTSFPMDSRVSFGSFFAHPGVQVGSGVYIGSYCVLGRTNIGAGTQIASGVQVLSGRQQHVRDEKGRISGAEKGHFQVVTIGVQCWIGAGAIVMADVGAHSTVGAGSIVTSPIPPWSVAVGNPARVIKTRDDKPDSMGDADRG
jgi:acetyltransferase-like isoleucine patch superfamily enzyme